VCPMTVTRRDGNFVFIPNQHHGVWSKIRQVSVR
jgi:hypothetical protein